MVDTACYCDDFTAGGIPCRPGTCPNVPKPPEPQLPGGNVPHTAEIAELRQRVAQLQTELAGALRAIEVAANANLAAFEASRCFRCRGSGIVAGSAGEYTTENCGECGGTGAKPERKPDPLEQRVALLERRLAEVERKGSR